ncbi:MAG: zinc ribbon domain-containing protein [Gammaproteobacteria bacterium]
MPIYEYQCGSCQHQLDAIQKFSDAPLVDCPKCNQPSLQKQISAAGFQLKGSGWYATDYKSKPNASETSSGSPTSSDNIKGSSDK